jgi:hypothetical protein
MRMRFPSSSFPTRERGLFLAPTGARALSTKQLHAPTCSTQNDADEIADWLMDDVIEWLRKNPRMPRLSRSEWELQIADLRNEFAFGLEGMIAELDTPFDVTERVLEALGISTE